MSARFRNFHLLQILRSLDSLSLPLDVFLRDYFKEHRSIGSHDRKYLAETVYGMTRWLGLIDFFCGNNLSWENRISVFEEISLEHCLKDPNIPLHQKVSFPKNYFDCLVRYLGEEEAISFCLESNHPAPITIRANALKGPREHLLSKLNNCFEARLGTYSPHAIHFPQRINFFTLPEFKEGYFEVQDEASQLGALQVKAKPGDHVLDYCSGSGGKSLAFGPLLQGKGQIYLHDVRSKVLLEAKKRCKRAGIQNVQFLSSEELKKKNLHQRMDWVLADVPCSGSGTLRRNPDMKWKFQEENLKELVLLQKEIFEKALSFVKPGGHIVYSTCSILPIENDAQVEFFLKEFPLKQIGPSFRSSPKKGEMDGFYAATLQKC
jgi:16S rRNA C967 or C1407 C5-methylase (RsmB/RsmF family)